LDYWPNWTDSNLAVTCQSKESVARAQHHQRLPGINLLAFFPGDVDQV
jgi:hypothetical protein